MGLAIRIIGEVTAEKLEILKNAGAIVRAVESSDAMTADWAKPPYDVLGVSPVASWPRSPA